jgi:hypothetical protein
MYRVQLFSHADSNDFAVFFYDRYFFFSQITADFAQMSQIFMTATACANRIVGAAFFLPLVIIKNQI